MVKNSHRTSGVKTKRFYYAFFGSPGFILAEQRVVRVNTNDPRTIAGRSRKGEYCFYFQEWVEEKTIVDGKKFQKEEPAGSKSSIHFLGGVLYSREELRETNPTEYNSLKSKRWNRVVKHPNGGWYPFRKGDVILRVPNRTKVKPSN